MVKRFFIVSLLLVFALTGMAGAADLSTLVPNDASFVLHTNLAKLFAHNSVKVFVETELAKQTPEEAAKFLEFKTQTGFDPYTDLTDMALYVSDKAGTNPHEFGAVIFTGSFDGNKLVQALADRDQAAVEDFESFKALKPRKDGDEMLLVLDDKTLVLGFAPGLKKVIEVKTGKAKSIGADARFAGLVKKADTSATVWGAGMLPEELKAKMRVEGPAPFMADSSAILFSLNFEKALTAAFIGEFPKAEAQKAAIKSIENFLTAIKPMIESHAGAMALFNAVKSEKVSGGVKVSATLTKEQVESIKNQLLEMAKAAPAAAPAPTSKD